MALTINTLENGDEVYVEVVGEVDVSNAGELREVLAKANDDGAKSVVVDLSQVPYIDSTGIGVLVGAVRRSRDEGNSLVVARPQRNVARVITLLGVNAELGIDNA